MVNSCFSWTALNKMSAAASLALFMYIKVYGERKKEREVYGEREIQYPMEHRKWLHLEKYYK